jgi:phosphoglycolate phosphatase-like HAD superfamily hydrolase
MGVIFDLDQTIVDSSIAAALRKKRDWPKVYSQIPQFQIYNGFLNVLKFLSDYEIKMAVVTTSPRPYCEKVLTHFNIPCMHIVAYHDASPPKPHPAPMIKALDILGEQKNQVISFGDRAIDIQSSTKAGIVSVGCLWGSDEKELLKREKPNYLIHKPIEIVNTCKSFFCLDS